MLAKGSKPWIIAALVFTAACSMALYITQIPYLRHITYTGFAGTMFFIWFFRDPKRQTKRCKHCMVSPADGKVIDIRGRKVCIFMNVHNVHVNRAPLPGKILSISHRKGGYIPAFYKDSDRNEQTRIVIGTEHGEVNITQIAGVMVRRIVTYVKKGDMVKQGERIGMIRFGSRVDVTIPDDLEITCKIGDRVLAGETVIAKLKGLKKGST